ncbi:MAG TPA: tyrosine-type recombinase/integrase [Terriglobia bacterium]|nr:tyrosine-type recombinase/integrase [Terriglobia bacterium]
MPLRAVVPPGRTTYYLRGTVKAGQRSRSVFESTGIRVGSAGAQQKANEIRLQREAKIYRELIHGADAVVTWSEAAAHYCEKRHLKRVARNRALADMPDKEAEYVLKLTSYFRRKAIDNIPLADFCDQVGPHLAAYFKEKHIAKGNKLPTMTRERDTYCAVMNEAVRQKWVRQDFPQPDLPEYRATEIPVNKWLYDDEIRLLIRLAPKHLKLFVAGIFATGRRGGEVIFMSRRRPDYNDPAGTGLSLEPGHEHFYYGHTKNGRPIIAPLPDWYVAMLSAYLASRTDKHDALILTEKKQPYKRPKKQRGFIVKTAWRSMTRKASAVLLKRSTRAARAGDLIAAERLRERSQILLEVTPHWGRHNAASHVLMQGMSERQAQRRGGWESAKMMRRYEHLSPEFNKEMANALDFGIGKRKTGASK